MSVEVAGPTRDARRTDTRERILAVAARLFHDHGYAGTSIQSIADELKVTKAALYYHFQSKQEILAALLAPVFEAVESVLANPAPVRTAAARRAFIEQLMEALTVCPPDAVRLSGDPMVVPHMTEHASELGMQQRIIALLACGLSKVDDVTDAAPEDMLRATGAIGAVIAGLDAYASAKPDMTNIDDATRDALVRLAVAALES